MKVVDTVWLGDRVLVVCKVVREGGPVVLGSKEKLSFRGPSRKMKRGSAAAMSLMMRTISRGTIGLADEEESAVDIVVACAMFGSELRFLSETRCQLEQAQETVGSGP